MHNLANFSNNCFWPISLKKIVALTSGFLPSKLITFPNPKRSCSTSIPTCRFEVSEGANPGEGTCAFANSEVVFTGGVVAVLGLENVSLPFLLQASRSSSKNELLVFSGLAVKSSYKYRASTSSKKRLGSQLISVPNLKREVA